MENRSPPLKKTTPPYNGNPTLIFEKSQPHRQLGNSKIFQPHPGPRGGAHYGNPKPPENLLTPVLSGCTANLAEYIY